MNTPKKLHRLQAWLYLIAGIVAPIILLIPSGGSEGGITAAWIVGGIFLALSASHWYRFKKTPEDAILYDISKQPPAEQINVSKRVIWIVGILGPALSYWIYHDLMTLETGAEQSVIVWAPVAMLYDNFGFWPAVLCWPLLCLVIIGASFFRIAKAKSMLMSEVNENAE